MIPLKMLSLLFGIMLLMNMVQTKIQVNPDNLDEIVGKFREEGKKEMEDGNLDDVDNSTQNVQEDQHKPAPKIRPLEAGTYNITNDFPLKDFESNYTAFILGVSHPDCDDCEDMEIMLDQFFKLGLMKDIAYKGKTLPIVRLDSIEYSAMLSKAKLGSKSSPRVYLFYKKSYYIYDRGFHLNFFIHFVNRHLYPIVILKSIDQVEKFRNTTIEWQENTPFYGGVYRPIDDIFDQMSKVTRVIAFVAHKSEYSYELKELAKVAKDLGYRDDLRIAKVTDIDIIKHYKFKEQKKWFDQESTNSFVAFTNGQKSEQYYDLATENYDLALWINAASLDAVENMTIQSLQIMEPMNMPMMVAFIDRDDPKHGHKSVQLLKNLQDLLPDHPQYLFGYVEYTDVFDERKQKIGVTWDDTPSLALFNPPSEGNVVFPRNTPFTEENLKIFIERGANSVLEGKDIRYPDESYDLSRFMRIPEKLSLENFTLPLENDSKDTLTLVFDPSVDYKEAATLAENYGLAARLLNDLKIRNIEFFYYDVNQFELPKDSPFDYYSKIPYIIMIPKVHKNRISIKHSEFTPQEIMMFVRDNASDPIKFPDHKSLNKKQTKNSQEVIDLDEDTKVDDL